MRTFPQTALLLTMTVAIGACGGSGSQPAAPAVHASERLPPRERYIAAADEFCAGANAAAADKEARVARIVASANTADEALAEIAPVLAAAHDQRRAQLADFRDIDPPAEGRETIERLWAAYERGNDLLGRLAAAARRRDASQFRSLVAQQRGVVTWASGLARGYGLRECGSGAVPARVAATARS